jgi:hypothetical protein
MGLHVTGQVGLVGQHLPAHTARALPCVDFHVMVEAGAEFETLSAEITLVERRLHVVVLVVPVALLTCTIVCKL